MRSLFAGLVAAAALTTFSADGYAVDYELKGFTSSTFQGNKTVRGFTEACQAEFSADTRMCTSMEVFQTVNWPSLPADTQAWAHPVLAPNQQDTKLLDQAGAVEPGSPNNGRLTCGSWTDAAANVDGTMVWNEHPSFGSGTAFITAFSCDTFRPVACCGPVPVAMVATVPFIGLFGRGLVIALMLSAAGAMLLRGGRAAGLIGRGDQALRG